MGNLIAADAVIDDGSSGGSVSRTLAVCMGDTFGLLAGNSHMARHDLAADRNRLSLAETEKVEESLGLFKVGYDERCAGHGELAIGESQGSLRQACTCISMDASEAMISARSSPFNSTSAAPTFSFTRSILRVPGIGTIHVFEPAATRGQSARVSLFYVPQCFV